MDVFYSFRRSKDQYELTEKDALNALRFRIEADGIVEEQLRTGGELADEQLGSELTVSDNDDQDKTVSKKQGVDDGTLLRWLRAESGNVEAAEKRLRAHAAWRAKFVPDGQITMEDIKNELAAKKVFIQGSDRSGQVVLVSLACRHYTRTRSVAEGVKFFCCIMDAAFRSFGGAKATTTKFCSIVDMRGYSYKNMDFALSKELAHVLQEHYPERLGKVIVFAAPTIFWGLWSAIFPFLDASTKSKVMFVPDTAAGRRVLLQHVDPKVLPWDFGGEAELTPVDLMLKLNGNV